MSVKETSMSMLTVSASKARAEFSRLGEQIARTGQPVTVFKNSKPWLVISPAAQPETGAQMQTVLDKPKEAALTADEQEMVRLAAAIDEEYFDVFEALAK
jgi:PHD/YefM family antitoxin component YafN of YafNO toxin-antitoxin module